MNFNKSIYLIILYFFLPVNGQSQLSDSILFTYYNTSIPVTQFEKGIFKQLSQKKEQSPVQLIEHSIFLIKNEKLAEASLYYFSGLMQFSFSSMNAELEKIPEKESVFEELKMEVESTLSIYLNSNLHNYVSIIQQFSDWSKNNGPANESSKELHELLLEQLNEYAVFISENPIQYITAIEEQKNGDLKNTVESSNDSYIEEPTEVENDIQTNGYDTRIKERTTSEIPQCFLMYDHDIPIQKNREFDLFAVAHGYSDTYIEADGATVTQQGNPLTYKVNPGNSDHFSISIYGIESETGTKSILGVFQFNTVDSLIPHLYFDKVATGNSIDYKKGELLCTYATSYNEYNHQTILSWELILSDKHFKGKGNVISDEAKKHIEQLGSEIPFIIKIDFLDQKESIQHAKGIFMK